MQGRPVWEHRFPVEANQLGTGTSPILHEGTLFLVRDVAERSPKESFAEAFDEGTGVSRELFDDPPRFIDSWDRNGDGALQQDEVPSGRAQDSPAIAANTMYLRTEGHLWVIGTIEEEEPLAD
jgi:hypothetical protein